MTKYIYKGISGYNSTVGFFVESNQILDLTKKQAEILKRTNLIEEVTSKPAKKEK